MRAPIFALLLCGCTSFEAGAAPAPREAGVDAGPVADAGPRGFCQSHPEATTCLDFDGPLRPLGDFGKVTGGGGIRFDEASFASPPRSITFESVDDNDDTNALQLAPTSFTTRLRIALALRTSLGERGTVQVTSFSQQPLSLLLYAENGRLFLKEFRDDDTNDNIYPLPESKSWNDVFIEVDLARKVVRAAVGTTTVERTMQYDWKPSETKVFVGLQQVFGDPPARHALHVDNVLLTRD